MMSPWYWIADAVLALLLAGTLGMSIRLDGALRVVRRDRAAFEALIANLAAATGAVKQGIQALRQEADRATQQIGRRSEDADKMATDLSFLIEAAERAGGTLEQRLRVAAGVLAEADRPKLAPAPISEPVPEPPLAAAPPIPRPPTLNPEVVKPAAPARLPEIQAEASSLAPKSLERGPLERGPDDAEAARAAADPVVSPPAELRERAGITTRRQVWSPLAPKPGATRAEAAAIQLAG